MLQDNAFEALVDFRDEILHADIIEWVLKCLRRINNGVNTGCLCCHPMVRTKPAVSCVHISRSAPVAEGKAGFRTMHVEDREVPRLPDETPHVILCLSTEVCQM